jgi:hypothetical protein
VINISRQTDISPLTKAESMRAVVTNSGITTKEGPLIKHLKQYKPNSASEICKGLLFGLRNPKFIAMVGSYKCFAAVRNASGVWMLTWR